MLRYTKSVANDIKRGKIEAGYSTTMTLYAAGSEDAPVVFDAYDTSWAGLWLYKADAHLDWTTVSGAGDAAFTASCGVPTAVCCPSCALTMTHSEITAAEGYGLYCTGSPAISIDSYSTIEGDGTYADTTGCD